ncbi:hypothetical protein ACTOV4_07110 [Brucella sp. C7-11G]|uniref:hypothetical protein n=1 Tax=Brucella pituitosa TaxID=571256 RepID=UPI003F4AD2B0
MGQRHTVQTNGATNFLIIGAQCLLAFCIVIFVIAGIFFVDDISGRHANVWSDILEKYQTLISGVLAIFAASITVRQMQISDRQQIKHAEATMALSIKEDFLTVERLHTSAIKPLKQLRNDFEKYSNIKTAKPSEFGQYLDDIKSTFPAKLSELRDVMSNPCFNDAVPLFNGRATAAFQTIKSSEEVLKGMSNFLQAYDMDLVEEPEINEFFSQYNLIWHGDDWKQRISGLSGNLQILARELDELQNRYQAIAEKSELLTSLSRN